MSSLQKHDKSELDKWGLVRVSEDFRVIALGLPVPRYRGAPLDPPLRSRFQARDITTLSYNVSIRFFFTHIIVIFDKDDGLYITKLLSSNKHPIFSRPIPNL